MGFNPLDLAGRQFLVTGASSGIGRETAQLIDQLGGSVLLTGRDQGRLEVCKSSLTGSGHSIKAIDLAADVNAIPAWMKQSCAESGPLNGVVHCAGIHYMMSVRACLCPGSTM